MTAVEVADELAVVVPDSPPELGRRGLRALLRILIAAAEEEWGPDWRDHVTELAVRR